jgi:hypothetical protein
VFSQSVGGILEGLKMKISPAGVLTLDFSHASLVRAGRITDTIRGTEVVDT